MTENKEPLVKINRDRYETVRTASGGKSLSNGDDVAQALEGLTLEELYGVADKLFKDNDFNVRYKNLNHGMQRMNLGNRIRGFVTKRDAENAKTEAHNEAVESGKKEGSVLTLKNTGLEALEKAVGPARKAADKRTIDAAKEAEAKAKAAAEKKETKPKASKKKAAKSAA